MSSSDRERTLPEPAGRAPSGRVVTPEELELVTHWQVQAWTPVEDGGERPRTGFACFGVTATGPDAARAKAEKILGAALPAGGQTYVSPILPPSLRSAGA